MTRARFPRLEGITSRVRLYEKLLHRAYNRLAMKRSINLRGWGKYDVYKTKKIGPRAPFFFTILAKELVQLKIDPSLYLKTMSEYGPVSNKKYLPAPHWFASPEVIKRYDWLQAKQRNMYVREKDYKRSKRGYRDEDILKVIKESAEFLQKAQENFKTGEMATLIALLPEFSPWFLSAFMPCAPRTVSKSLMVGIKSSPDIYSPVMTCIHYFKKNPELWELAKKVLKESLSQDEAIILRYPRE
jgi:hypothetical protein